MLCIELLTLLYKRQQTAENANEWRYYSVGQIECTKAASYYDFAKPDLYTSIKSLHITPCKYIDKVATLLLNIYAY